MYSFENIISDHHKKQSWLLYLWDRSKHLNQDESKKITMSLIYTQTVVGCSTCGLEIGINLHSFGLVEIKNKLPNRIKYNWVIGYEIQHCMPLLHSIVKAKGKYVILKCT